MVSAFEKNYWCQLKSELMRQLAETKGAFGLPEPTVQSLLASCLHPRSSTNLPSV